MTVGSIRRLSGERASGVSERPLVADGAAQAEAAADGNRPCTWYAHYSWPLGMMVEVPLERRSSNRLAG